jgi:hypothetical protein
VASVAEIATELHRLVKAGLAKSPQMDPMTYAEALKGFQSDVLAEAISKFLSGIYDGRNAAFYPSAPQLAGYCRRVQQERHEASYAERFDQQAREARAAQAALDKLRERNSTPEARARIEQLMKQVPKTEREIAAEIEEKLTSAVVREVYGMNDAERMAEVPDAKR